LFPSGITRQQLGFSRDGARAHTRITGTSPSGSLIQSERLWPVDRSRCGSIT
jgi:hypothetical protein